MFKSLFENNVKQRLLIVVIALDVVLRNDLVYCK